MARIRQDIYTLASDSMEGRKAGYAGEHKAYTYITGRLHEAGIGPWQGSSYIEPFTQGYAACIKPSHLSIPGKKFVWRYDFGVCSCSSNDSVFSVWANFGYGMPAPGLDSSESLPDVNGKIAIINLDTPPEFRKTGTADAVLSPESRISNAIGKGACGIIMYNDPGGYRKRLFDFTRSDTFSVPVMYVLPEVVQAIIDHPGSKVNMSAHVSRAHRTFNNIVAYIDNKASRTIILGAHYDHLGKSLNSKDRGAFCVGADDNASGTAGILELARYYRHHRDSLNNYLVILFSAEEEGLLGSEYFVGQMRPSLKDSINFMMNFDMIGRLGCEGMQVTAEATGSSAAWNRLYKEIPHTGFRLIKISPSLPFSDHDPFYLKGIPILYLTTGLHGYYHTPKDRPATINYTGMVSIINYAEMLVNTAGSGKKVTYRKVPALCMYIETAGFVFDFIGESLSF